MVMRVAGGRRTVNALCARQSEYFAQKWPEKTSPAKIVSNETTFSA